MAREEGRGRTAEVVVHECSCRRCFGMGDEARGRTSGDHTRHIDFL